MVNFLNVISGFVFTSSTCSDVESTKDSDSTESADEVDDIYEMLVDETSFDDNVPSTSEHIEATTTQINSYTANSVGEMTYIYSKMNMKWSRIQNLFAHSACFW